MAKKETLIMVPDELIMRKIYFIRGQKVMLDRDLADLYQVETKRLKEQVRRNIERFPKHFMFELSKEEAEVSRSQFATLKRGENIKYLPYAFTEHGVLMLSNVLKSKRAIAVSIRIIDV
ncbi:MAG: ORF6N domain-containing protein, partial [Bacteroidia bacterium]|nr:ORF6N domain-containing protein [Bacteroidia bacterium]